MFLDPVIYKLKLFYHFGKFAYRYWETLGAMERARRHKEKSQAVVQAAPAKAKYDLIIVGCGPAGLAAAVYAARQKLDFLMISKDVGGQTNLNTYPIENYLGYHYITGAELEQKFEEHLQNLKISPQMDEVKKIERADGGFNVVTSGATYFAKCVLVVTGRVNKMLGVPGELDYQGRGVSFCSHCDGPLFRDKVVAVVGTGKYGLDTVAQLVNIASKIYLIETGSDLDYGGQTLKLAKSSPKVEILTNTKVLEIKGDSAVRSVKVSQNGQERSLDVSGVFVNVGFIPSTGIVEGLVEMNDKKEIVTDKFNATSVEGVFAAGDCTDIGEKQVIVSAGEGAKALIAASEYLAKIGGGGGIEEDGAAQ